MCRDGVMVEFFSQPLGPDDLSRYGYSIGDCAGQQVWEALCAVVALKHWRDAWRSVRSSVKVKGDNHSMLNLVAECKGRGAGLNLLARECALLLAASAYHPVDAEHIPGVANVVADWLSRKWQPGHGSKAVPDFGAATETHPPVRTAEWYLASRVPRRVRGDAGGGIAWGAA